MGKMYELKTKVELVVGKIMVVKNLFTWKKSVLEMEHSKCTGLINWTFFTNQRSYSYFLILERRYINIDIIYLSIIY